MKKAKNIVRKVFSKTSATNNSNESLLSTRMEQEAQILKQELEALNDQIGSLRTAINSLQNETERKEVAIANLAREKEKINHELLKTKRTNAHLSQQLSDERKFYLKEKEIYCQEMNECKKLKRVMNNNNSAGKSSDNSNSFNSNNKSVEEYKAEIVKLKQTLNQTLEANYNLSIKFLRMKNTKTCLKTELQTVKLEHEKLINDYKIKIENLTAELNDLVNESMNSPLSPSSKKYLQLVKQNSCLVYENLCLQLEVDKLNFKFQKLTLDKTKSETNQRLQYIHHNPQERRETSSKTPKTHKDSKKVNVRNETPEKLEKSTVSSCSCCYANKDEKTIKLFERHEKPGTPEITIINEKKSNSKKSKKKKEESTNKNEEQSLDVHRVSDTLMTSCENTVATNKLTRSRSLPIIFTDIQVFKKTCNI